jgi:hypothetical protein
VCEGCCSGRWRQRSGECRARGGSGGGVMAKIYDGLWSFDRRADFVAFSKFLSVESASPNCRRGSRSVCACQHQRRECGGWNEACGAPQEQPEKADDQTRRLRAEGRQTRAMGRRAGCGRGVVDGEMAWRIACMLGRMCGEAPLRPPLRCSTRDACIPPLLGARRAERPRL